MDDADGDVDCGRRRGARTVGDSVPPEPPLDEAYFARMLEGIARRGYIPASPRPSR